MVDSGLVFINILRASIKKYFDGKMDILFSVEEGWGLASTNFFQLTPPGSIPAGTQFLSHFPVTL